MFSSPAMVRRCMAVDLTRTVFSTTKMCQGHLITLFFFGRHHYIITTYHTIQICWNIERRTQLSNAFHGWSMPFHVLSYMLEIGYMALKEAAYYCNLYNIDNIWFMFFGVQEFQIEIVQDHEGLAFHVTNCCCLTKMLWIWIVCLYT